MFLDLERQNGKIQKQGKSYRHWEALGMDGHGWTVILALIIERLSGRDIWQALVDQGRSKLIVQNLKPVGFSYQDPRFLFEILSVPSSHIFTC